MDNFNGCYSSYPSEILFPRTEEDMKAAVLKAVEEKKRLRVVGSTTHSWGGLAMSDEDQLVVDTQYYDAVLQIDAAAGTVRAQSGISIHNLLIALKAEGLTLKNCGAIDAQSLGGAMATSTHGSNDANGGPETLSDNIVSIRLMDHRGDVHTLDAAHPHFNAARTSLGMLGIVLDVTLKVRESFQIYKNMIDISRADLTVARVEEDLRKANHSAEYFLFPQSANGFGLAGELCEVASVELPEADYAADASAMSFVHKTNHDMAMRHPERIPQYLDGQLDLYRNANTKWVAESFDVLARQSKGQVSGDHFFLDSEYTIPLAHLQEALDFVVETIRAVTDVVMWVYLRFQPATDSLLAMNQGPTGQMMAYLDVGYGTNQADHRARVLIEQKLTSLGARPHWGKVNDLTYEKVLALYPEENVRLFKEAKAAFDPTNMYGNEYTDKAFGYVKAEGAGAGAGAEEEL